MVGYPDVHQGQGVDQAPCKADIRPARLGNSRRVVVRQDDGRGIVVQGTDDHLARVDTGAIDGAAKQFLEYSNAFISA